MPGEFRQGPTPKRGTDLWHDRVLKATFGKLLKRKESILFFNDVVKQVSETKEEK